MFAFEVYDPRLHFPPTPLRKDEAHSLSSNGVLRTAMLDSSPELSNSALWNTDHRETVLTPSFKKSDLDHRRHQLGLPGSRLRALAQDDRVPIVVIANRSAFTLVFPRGWSQPILNSIIYTATLVGGLEERRAQHREFGIPSFPEHYGSVCEAGIEWTENVAKEDERRWMRRPPGRRVDHPEWKPDWSKVLHLNGEEQGGLRPLWCLPHSLGRFAGKAEKAVNAFRKERGMAPITPGFARNALVHVTLKVEGRGSPSRMARVYALDKTQRGAWIEAVDDTEQRVSDVTSPALKVDYLTMSFSVERLISAWRSSRFRRRPHRLHNNR